MEVSLFLTDLKSNIICSFMLIFEANAFILIHFTSHQSSINSNGTVFMEYYWIYLEVLGLHWTDSYLLCVKMKLVSLISRLFSAWSEQVNTLKSESDHIISQPKIYQRPPVAHEMKLANVADKNTHYFFPWFLKPYPYFSSLSNFLYLMSLCLGVLEKAVFSSKNVFLFFPYIPAHTRHSSILS